MAEVQDATLDRAGLTAGFIAALSWGMTGTLVHLVTTASAGMITVCRLVVSASVLAAVAVLRRMKRRGRRRPGWPLPRWLRTTYSPPRRSRVHRWSK